MKEMPPTERVGSRLKRKFEVARGLALTALGSGLANAFVRLRRPNYEAPPPPDNDWKTLVLDPGYPQAWELRLRQKEKDYISATRPKQLFALKFNNLESGYLLVINNSSLEIPEKQLGSLVARSGQALAYAKGDKLAVEAICIGAYDQDDYPDQPQSPGNKGLNGGLNLSEDLLKPEAATEFDAALKAGLTPEEYRTPNIDVSVEVETLHDR